MPTTITRRWGIDPWRLRQLGAYDVPLDGPEAPVYLDPRLLRRSKVPEFAKAMDLVGAYYTDVFADIRLANEVSNPADAKNLRERARQKLRFPELPGLRIGYGQGESHGRGVGPVRGGDLYSLANQFVTDKFEHPVLFEMFAVVKEGVGADLVSDMLASITKHRLYEFSERVALELHLPTQEVATSIRSYQLAWNDKRREAIIFPPFDALGEIPGFGNSKKFDKFEFSNEEIRKAINDLIKAHGHAGAARQYLLEHRGMVPTLLAAYTDMKPRAPDEFAGEAGPIIAGRQIYEALKLDLSRVTAPNSEAELEAAVVEVVKRFKKYVDSGQARNQLHGGKVPRDEKFVQGMFSNFVENFCEDRNIRVTREADDGMGPVDFLFSIGKSMAVALELKLSSNPGLVRTFKHQVQAYAAASGAQCYFFVVIDLKEERPRLQQLVKAHGEAPLHARVPLLSIIDGRDSPSASKITTERKPLPQPAQRPAQSKAMAPRPAPGASAAAPPTPLAVTTRTKSGAELLAEALEKWRKAVGENRKPPP